ncbi:MAG: hypothetical protein KC613_01135 [Myxococcales bacterium]|nr:hypothetical protein [Myxococcales bacterium]MCB9522263.1 hypothetical protein [Myxococcales bacterium]
MPDPTVADAAAGWADLHLHVLPGIDDGARDLQASLEMCRGLADLGYRRLIATPHADGRRHTYGPDRIQALCGEVQTALTAEGIPIELGWGAEYAYGDRFHQDLTGAGLITLGNSRYILLELPEQFMPATMPQVLFEVGTAGYFPIIAHPERCEPFHDNLDRLLQIAGGRAIIQVSFRSLAGTFGRTIKKTAWRLVEDGHAELLATDCHSPKELKKIVRPVLKALHRKVSADRLDRMLRRTPHRMLSEIR